MRVRREPDTVRFPSAPPHSLNAMHWDKEFSEHLIQILAVKKAAKALHEIVVR
jgi:hypothetical protein